MTALRRHAGTTARIAGLAVALAGVGKAYLDSRAATTEASAAQAKAQALSEEHRAETAADDEWVKKRWKVTVKAIADEHDKLVEMNARVDDMQKMVEAMLAAQAQRERHHCGAQLARHAAAPPTLARSATVAAAPHPDAYAAHLEALLPPRPKVVLRPLVRGR